MMLAASGPGRPTAALIAALLSERDIFRRSERGQATTADLAARLAVVGPGRGNRPGPDRAAVAAVRRQAEELSRRLERLAPSRAGPSGSPRSTSQHGAQEGGTLLMEAYPDRIAVARGGGRYRLRHGGGAALDERDPLAGSGWLVVADVEPATGGAGRGDGRIRLAAAIDAADVERIARDQIRTVVRLEWDEKVGDLRAVTERTLDALVIETSTGPAPAGPDTTAALVAHAVGTGLASLNWTPAARSLQARVGWARRALGEAWPDVSDAALVETAEEWLTPRLAGARGRADLKRVDPAVAIRAALGGQSRELDVLLPSSLTLGSGRKLSVDYTGDQPRAAVRVQELYGTAVQPSVAGGRVPVTLELLSPAGRPIQVTADLPGFWAGSWRLVRREMAGRYPKHSWPEDPSSPPPAARRGPPTKR
jgi:ATP-dependent helicase HrpB